MRRFLKTALMVVAIFVFLLHGFVIQLLTRDRRRRREILVRNVSLYSKLALTILSVDVRSAGLADSDPGPFLFVGNHLSYLDLMVLASVRPSVFVTSVDMGQVPFLGRMAEVGGSLFIERRNRDRLDYDIGQIETVLNEGFDVTLFPEGTSTNGTGVKMFKRGLLPAAVRACKKIKPMSLHYDVIDGEPFGDRNRDDVCWYGDMKFGPHFLRLLSLKKIRVSVLFHPAIGFDDNVSKDEIASTCQRIVEGGYESLSEGHFPLLIARPQESLRSGSPSSLAYRDVLRSPHAE